MSQISRRWTCYIPRKQFLNSLLESEWSIIEMYVKRTCASSAHHVINAFVSPAVNILKLQLLLALYSRVCKDVINGKLLTQNNRLAFSHLKTTLDCYMTCVTRFLVER